AFKLLHSWDIWFILSFRFIWGIRTISPIVIGSSGIPPPPYKPLNLAAAIVWTLISCVGGYMFSRGIVDIGLHVVKRYFGYLTIGVIVFIIGFVLLKRWMKRRVEMLGKEGPFHTSKNEGGEP